MTDGTRAGIGWQRLRQESGTQTSDLGVPSLVLDASAGAGPARLAIGAEREARLLVPLAAGERFPMVHDTHGLELRDSVLLLQGLPVRFIDVACRGERLEAVFEKLVDEVVRRLRGGAAPANALEDAITDFRNLLSGANRERPSIETALGLIGELIILNRLLLVEPDAWQLWTGPAGGRHDFRGGDRAIEVKTSLRAQSRIVEVSAIDQLAAPPGGHLLLAHCVLEYDGAGPLSVVGEATHACTIASDPAAVADRLALLGYDQAQADEWSSFRFSLFSQELYSVTDGFPRLTPASFAEGELPVGVSHFRYRVNLDFASEFRFRPAEADNALQEIVSCLSL
jgi:hypothetical protein